MLKTRTPALRRNALFTRTAIAALALTGAQFAVAQNAPPPGVGIYLNTTVAGTNNYVGNGNTDYATGSGISIYNAGGTQSTGSPQYNVTSAPIALGATGGTLSVTGTSEGGGPSAQASSTADLASGVLRVSASGDARGLAGALMRDNLTFQVAGGGYADITVTAHLDGQFGFLDPSYASASQTMTLNFGGASFNELGGTSDVNGLSSYFGHSGPSNNLPPQGWLSYSFSNESPTGFDFTAVVRVTDGERSVMQLGLSTDCFKASCGFDHTGTIGLALSDGVSFTSDSGVFLTANAGAAPVPAVPEPETWALMLGGLGVVGGIARRRGRNEHRA